MRIDAFAHDADRVLTVESDDRRTAMLAMASANGTWDIGDAAAAGTIARLRRQVSPRSVPEMFDAIELLVAAHREACDEADPDRDPHEGRIDAMLAWVMPGSFGSIYLAWAGACRAYLIRRRVIYAHARPHCHGETLIGDARRREQVYADHEQMPYTCTRSLDADGPPNVERLAVSWPFSPGDTLVMLNDGAWSRLDDVTIVRLVHGERPAHALVEAANSPRSTVAAIVVHCL